MDQLPRSSALKGGARLVGAGLIALLAGAASVEGQTAGQQATPAAPPTTASSAPSLTLPSPVSPPLSVRLEPGGSLRVESGGTPPWWSYWVPTVGPIISGVLAFLGAWLGLSIAQRNTLRTIEAAQRTTEASVWQKANETELKDLLGKLDGFYGPFMQMSDANRLMAEDVRSRQPEGHRLLLKVFDREWLQSLSPGDQTIVAEICKNAAVLEGFITQKAGMVDEKVLPYLVRASAHFRVLNLAYKGELGTDSTQFARYVFPKSLDGVLALEVERLKRRCDSLRAEPSKAPGPMAPLVLLPEHALKPWSAIDLQVDEPEV
ncbi:hypothetical protein [Azospirillum sp. SYSU D00513]|uniref:hypothetical protein n=2 Tax=Pseudomonadati TaxID=3379134 RepID=UPI001A96814B|nr:hypothetical protein [Azospirillum sp. SYSU D00513]